MSIRDSGTPSQHEHLGFLTTCGRHVTVGWMTLGGSQRPARRVTLDIGHTPGHYDGTWAALTPAEARQLAEALLRQVDAAAR